ncbi:MAG: hypothetical protein LBR36_08360 [Bacteroidales bacterium]|jgi:hypothetical protein|nr:hypothetical protein [Bacteroidales bacterium]
MRLQQPLGTGSIKVVSTSSNPYEIYLDGVYKFDLAGGANRTISNVSTGTHTVRVLQISGYILYPTDKTYNVTVQSGYIHTVTFP